jgi:hypothetical protein
MKNIIKIIVVLALITGGIFILLTCSGGSCIHKIDKSLPDITSAPWIVKTPSHVYYANVANQSVTGITMAGWYENVKNKWIYHKETIQLTYVVYGVITLTRR